MYSARANAVRMCAISSPSKQVVATLHADREVARDLVVEAERAPRSPGAWPRSWRRARRSSVEGDAELVAADHEADVRDPLEDVDHVARADGPAAQQRASPGIGGEVDLRHGVENVGEAVGEVQAAAQAMVGRLGGRRSCRRARSSRRRATGARTPRPGGREPRAGERDRRRQPARQRGDEGPPASCARGAGGRAFRRPCGASLFGCVDRHRLAAQGG